MLQAAGMKYPTLLIMACLLSVCLPFAKATTSSIMERTGCENALTLTYKIENNIFSLHQMIIAETDAIEKLQESARGLDTLIWRTIWRPQQTQLLLAYQNRMDQHRQNIRVLQLRIGRETVLLQKIKSGTVTEEDQSKYLVENGTLGNPALVW